MSLERSVIFLPNEAFEFEQVNLVLSNVSSF